MLLIFNYVFLLIADVTYLITIVIQLVNYYSLQIILTIFNLQSMIFVLFAILLLGMGVYLSFKVTNNKDDSYPIKTS